MTVKTTHFHNLFVAAALHLDVLCCCCEDFSVKCDSEECL